MARIPRLLPLIAVAIGGVVAVRAIGVAPGLFEGAKAWAEEASPSAAAAPAKTAAAACALTPEQLAQQAGISPAELRIIQSLSQRRTELDARDQDFATMLPLMTAAEQKLDAKVQALAALKAEMQQMLGQVDEREKAEIDRLVQVYSAMRPKEAAPVMASLEDRVRLPVAAAMRPRTLAAIMAQMQPAQAKELTEKLAARFQAQQMAARAIAAENTPPPAQTSTPEPAPPPAAQPAAQAAAAPAQTRPTPRPAARQPANRPAARPAARPASRPAATPPAPSGPQPYQPAAADSVQPRQTVQ
jgi:flagellar motility protein MotE (MotC chaperone)